MTILEKYYASVDIKSNFRFVYALKGDELTVCIKSGDVWIMEDIKGNRFSCHKDKLSIDKPLPDLIIEIEKPIDLFNQL